MERSQNQGERKKQKLEKDIGKPQIVDDDVKTDGSTPNCNRSSHKSLGAADGNCSAGYVPQAL